MTNNDFMNFVRDKNDDTLKVLFSKGDEYSKLDNRFHNFDNVKLLFDLIKNKDSDYFPYFALMSKQFISIVDILNGKKYDLALLKEKFGDVHNYLYLLEAKLTEVLNENNT
jgi:hypothetical protein